MDIDRKQSLNLELEKDSLTHHILRRRSTIDSIKESLSSISIISKNHNIVKHRFQHQEKHRHLHQAEEIGSPSSESESHEFSISELFEEKYQILEKLGEGSSGVVHRCSRRTTKQIFAVKSFTFEDQHVLGLKENFLMQKSLNHPSIISYEALYLDMKKHLGWLVMEFINWPSLGKATLQNEQELRIIMQQLFEALSYLHKENIVHRDIKSENIMYDPLSKTIKIIDFGISRKNKRRGMSFQMWTITGTLFYRAPEMFSGGYKEGVDIWAAGVLLYKLVSGKTPFQSEYHHQTIKNIVQADLTFSQHFEKYSHEIKCLIKVMLNRNTNERPSAFTLLKDVWFYAIPSHLNTHTGSLKQIEDEFSQKDKSQNSLNYENHLATSMRQITSLNEDKESSSFSDLKSSGSFLSFSLKKKESNYFTDENLQNNQKEEVIVRTRKTMPSF